jgi:hypothetical protein
MRKYLLSAAILILVGVPFNVGSANHKNVKYKNKEMTLISFSISIHPETKRYLDQFESYFPSVKNPNADKIIAKIKEQTWGSIVDILQKDIEMIILPISTFGKNISYDNYGFPDVNISKAQRKGFSKFYMKIDLQIGPEIYQPLGSFKDDTTKQRVKLNSGEIKPMVTITITTYSANGIVPIDKYVGNAIASNTWSSDDSSIIDGLVNATSRNDPSTLMSLINEAINDVSANIQIQ